MSATSEFDLAQYQALRMAEADQAQLIGLDPGAPPPVSDNPAIANPTFVPEDLPTRLAVETARVAAFNIAANAVRGLWRAGRVEWASRLDGMAGDPFRLASYVALAGLMRACPQVEPVRLAAALGFNTPHQALDMLAAKRTDKAWSNRAERCVASRIRRACTSVAGDAS